MSPFVAVILTVFVFAVVCIVRWVGDGDYRREQTEMCVLLTARTVARPMLR